MKDDTSKHLPAEAVRQLQRAASTNITANDPLARVKAIETATRRVKLQYPQHFKGSRHEN